MDFICRSSQNEVESQHLQGQHHKSTCSLSSLLWKSATVKGLNLSEASVGARMDHPGSVVKAPITERLQSTSLISGKVDAYTRVIQHYSRALYPQKWTYPLSLAFKHWESHKTQTNAVNGQNGRGSTNGEETCKTGLKTQLPKPLPLKCPSPHQHRWGTPNTHKIQSRVICFFMNLSLSRTGHIALPNKNLTNQNMCFLLKKINCLCFY